MIRPIIHDPLFLGQQSKPATEADRQIITDLMDTLRANLDRCVGMAANMIGEKKRIIVFCNGPMQMVMVNPQAACPWRACGKPSDTGRSR